ncbi:unnamed protein product [Owenia fusiformis]|nr:unnamed protein product [Owenia fusiformis]
MQSGSILYVGLAVVLLCSALTEARYAGERSALTDLLLARLLASEKRELPSPPTEAEDSTLFDVLSDMLKKSSDDCTNWCEELLSDEDNGYGGDFKKCYKDQCEK